MVPCSLCLLWIFETRERQVVMDKVQEHGIYLCMWTVGKCNACNKESLQLLECSFLDLSVTLSVVLRSFNV